MSSQESPPLSYEQFEYQGTLKPFEELRVHVYRHKKSGLTVLISPQAQTGTVAYVTAYNVGSRYEVKGRTGLAHLFEHMMFRGTESFPEPFKTLSSWGDRFNAYTSYDLTLYHELVPKEMLGKVAQFEAERMRKLLITKEGFNTERGAVVSERKMRTEDSPMGRLYWELYQLAYDQHPYKTGPIGWQEDLDATSFEDALDFYNRYYAPNRATLALVGDIEVSEALKTLSTYYGAYTDQPWTEPRVVQEKSRHDHRRKVIPMKAESVFMADTFFGPRYSDTSVAAQSIFCSLLADSTHGFLVGELVEKGVARSVSGGCSPSVDPGLSGFVLVGNPGISVDKLEKAYDHAKKGFLKWVTAERVEQMKLYYLAGQYGSMRDPMDLAEDMARSYVTAGDPLYSFKFLEQAKKVTLADVKKEFEKWGHAAQVRLIIEPSKETAALERKR